MRRNPSMPSRADMKGRTSLQDRRRPPVAQNRILMLASKGGSAGEDAALDSRPMNPGHNAANCCSCTFARRASVSIVRLFPRIEIWPRPKSKTLCPVKLFSARWAKTRCSFWPLPLNPAAARCNCPTSYRKMLTREWCPGNKSIVRWPLAG